MKNTHSQPHGYRFEVKYGMTIKEEEMINPDQVGKGAPGLSVGNCRNHTPLTGRQFVLNPTFPGIDYLLENG